jgi:dihydrofolate reductase
MMRKIVAIDQVTLDGVMQGPGGPEEDARGRFVYGGWSQLFGDDALWQILVETVTGADLLFGRRTYDVFADYWPKQDNAVGKAFDKATKYVVTRSRDRLGWEKSVRIDGDVVDEVGRLKASDGPAVHMWGSHQLLQTLIAADLVDEFRLWVYPVVIGTGKRLFESGVPPRVLALVESRSTPKGVLLNTYRPTGPLPREERS